MRLLFLDPFGVRPNPSATDNAQAQLVGSGCFVLRGPSSGLGVLRSSGRSRHDEPLQCHEFMFVSVLQTTLYEERGL